MTTNPTLIKKLLDQHLPPYELIHCSVDDMNIHGLNFKVAGVAVRLDSALEVYGSSSHFTESPLLPAAFECLERYAIQAKSPLVQQEHPTYRISLSNGVAIHQTMEQAMESAALELRERNEILKSWYFNTPIKRLPVPADLFGAGIRAFYDFALVDFSTDKDYYVLGLFGFPKTKEVNLVYGFGCAKSQGKATLKALKEFITRLGFLWGETPSDEVPDFKGPLFHQEFYMRPENIMHIKEWIFEKAFAKKVHAGFQMKDIQYENLTPNEWKGDLKVMKASSSDCIPLFFGQVPPQYIDFHYRYDIPHPII